MTINHGTIHHDDFNSTMVTISTTRTTILIITGTTINRHEHSYQPPYPQQLTALNPSTAAAQHPWLPPGLRDHHAATTHTLGLSIFSKGGAGGAGSSGSGTCGGAALGDWGSATAGAPGSVARAHHGNHHWQ